MIVVVGGIKGGSGKTTIATNLAALRASSGKRVLLVDSDTQKSSAEWIEQRNNSGDKERFCGIGTKPIGLSLFSGQLIFFELQKLSNEYDDIIVDCGGRDTVSQRAALLIADIFVVPFRPRSVDIWTLGHLCELIQDNESKKLSIFACINQADASGSDNEDARTAIEEVQGIECFRGNIGNRKAFSNAFSVGLGAHEYYPADKKAVSEMKALYNHVYRE